ncbi:hypothetical protein GPALN_003412 [Globodera pallida]|nr:hypothetical protein GPALN_003412 [Globodera pallida]
MPKWSITCINSQFDIRLYGMLKRAMILRSVAVSDLDNQPYTSLFYYLLRNLNHAAVLLIQIEHEHSKNISATTAAVVAAVVAAAIDDRAAYGSMNKNHRSAAGSNTGWLAVFCVDSLRLLLRSFPVAGGQNRIA